MTSKQSMYEVELKFPLSDLWPVAAQLAAMGARPDAPIWQSDLYFAHPQRDFEKTDEALRIRTVGERNFVTYKGPVIDSRTKTRHEIEVPLGDGPDVARQFAEVLEALGFRRVREVRKHRIPHHLTCDGRKFEIVLDEVDDLGSFVEIETLADETERSAARDAILALAARLGLTNPERKSYLCLLLERDNLSA